MCCGVALSNVQHFDINEWDVIEVEQGQDLSEHKDELSEHRDELSEHKENLEMREILVSKSVTRKIFTIPNDFM